MKTGMKEEYFMTIAEVSRKYDITADTLRYYERIGLIMSPAAKVESGIMMKHPVVGLN